jgi:surface polysaccharide O-acyltransferase-like enzyme
MDRLSQISFVAIILVVFIHGYNVSVVIAGQPVGELYAMDWWIQSFIGDGLSRVGVPLFFTISGYRYSYGIDKFTPGIWWQKLKKRFKSLVIPFFTWSILGLLFVVALQLFPMSKPYFNSEPILSRTPLELLQLIFVNPFPYQLWFLQVLWLLVLISPVFLLFVKFVDFRFGIILLIILWVFEGGYNGWSEYFFEGATFFTFGIMLQKQPTYFRPGNLSCWMAVLWIFMIVLKLWLISNGEVFWADICSKASVVVGMLVVWQYASPLISKLRISKLVIAQTFFIYLAHEPLLTLVKKGLLVNSSPLNEYLALVYFISVGVTILIVLFWGRFLNRFLPNVYSFLIGGR